MSAESYSVRAILSATDKNFSSTLKGASSIVESLAGKIKSGFAFGVLAGMGQQAFSALTSGASDLVSEINSASKAWGTFEGNMKILGKSGKYISDAKKELQKYAQQTVYSSSEMASTFAQLEAVGTKNTMSIVKGFGGLAAAAENPAQAMKSLSLQATQMAAKPKVAWEDFKIMMEQAPAGMSQVAKAMGMTMQELISKIQDGEIATEDFFAAVEKAGNSKGFQKMATEAKTVDQALDGLKETAGNKLLPAFDVLSDAAIGVIDKITGAFESIDGEKIASKVTQGIETASQFLNTLKTSFSGVGQEIGEAIKAVGDALGIMNAEFNKQDALENFGSVMLSIAGTIKSVSNYIEEHADAIAKALPWVIKLAIAYKGLKVVQTIAPGLMSFGSALGSISKKIGGGLIGKLFGTSKAQEAVGKSAGKSSKKMLASAKSFMMVGAGVALIAASFYMLASAAIKLSDAGGVAIALFVGMAAAVTALGLGITYMMSNIKSSPKKIAEFGNSFLKVGAGIAFVVASLAALALALVPLASLGSTAVPALAAFGIVVAGLAVVFATFGQSLKTNLAGIVVFAAAISVLALAMAPIASTGTEGAIAMATFGIVVAALVAVFALLGSALTAAIPAMLAFGAAILMVGAGMALAEGFIAALPPVITALGDVFVQVGSVITSVIDAVCSGFETLCDGVATVIDAISGGLSSVLDAIAGVIESIGTSAKNAGTGFKYVAQGITMISELSLSDMITSLAAVGTGLAEISTNGAGIPDVASGMQMLVAALILAAANLAIFNASVMQMSALASSAAMGVNQIKSAFSGFTITPPDITPVIAAFKSIIVQAKTLVPGLTAAGQSGGRGLASGLKAGSAQARSVMQSAVNTVTSSGKQLQTNLTNAGRSAGSGFSKSLQGGLMTAVSVSKSSMSTIITVMRSTYGSAYSSGAYISQGFARGMLSQLAVIRSAAAQMAAAADAAVRAKAKIHSPSRVADKLGGYWGKGLAGGIIDTARDVWNAAKKIVAIPNIAMPSLALAYGGELSAEYDYSRKAEYNITVVSEMDGREVARSTATYMQDELDRKQTRDSRKYGIR